MRCQRRPSRHAIKFNIRSIPSSHLESALFSHWGSKFPSLRSTSVSHNPDTPFAQQALPLLGTPTQTHAQP